MKHLLLFLVCLLFHAAAFAAPLQVEQFRLENGMLVVVIPNHKVPAVTHMIWYRTGASSDPLGKSGIAHFLEHLMFKGTKKVEKGEFSSRVAQNGGNDNAFTSHDYTTYFQSIAVDKLPMVMEMEADRMKNLILLTEEVLKERKVILEERSMRLDNDPQSLLNEQMKAALYLNHPYGRPIIGWRHEMEQLTLEDAKRFYKQYYVPNNAFVVVAGDITVEQLKPLAEKYYGAIPYTALPFSEAMEIAEPPAIAARRVEMQDEKVQTPELRRYYLAPTPGKSPLRESIALMILEHALGGEGTGRLYQTLVMEQQVAASADVHYDGFSLGPTHFDFVLSPQAASSLEALEKALDEVLLKVREEGIAEEELVRAKTLLKADSIYARDGYQTLAFLFGHVLAAGLPLDYLANWERHVDEVTLKDVNDAARKILDIRQSVTGRLLPLKKAE